MRIVLSSTFSDLAEHRRVIATALQELRPEIEVELVRFEDMSATSQPPLKERLQQIESAHWYILLLGWRYGYVPEGEDRSFTEIEYEFARQHLDTVLCFVLDDSYPVPPKYVETGDAAVRLRKLKERLSRENVVRTFTTPADLAQKVVSAVTRYWHMPLGKAAQAIVDKPDIDALLVSLREERSRHLSIIEEFRQKLGSVVPAIPIWRSRKFEVDSTLGFCLLPFQDQFMRVFEEAAVPSLEASGLRGLHAGQIFDNREIMEDVWESICSSRLVIADVSQRNPNVFYELGVCHTLGKEVIVITQSASDVPFDIRHRRYIEYHPDRLSALRAKLQQTIQRVLIRGSNSAEA